MMMKNKNKRTEILHKHNTQVKQATDFLKDNLNISENSSDSL